MVNPNDVKQAIRAYEDIGRQYAIEGEYALCTSKTCPRCKHVAGVALGKSKIYECPKCGYVGEWLDEPSGFFEYRKEALVPISVLWPIKSP